MGDPTHPRLSTLTGVRLRFSDPVSSPSEPWSLPSVLRMHVSSVSSFPSLSPPLPSQVDPPLRCDLFLPFPLQLPPAQHHRLAPSTESITACCDRNRDESHHRATCRDFNAVASETFTS